MVVTEENGSNRRNPYRSAISSTTNLMRNDQVVRMAPSRLTNGTARRATSDVPTQDVAPASTNASLLNVHQSPIDTASRPAQLSLQQHCCEILKSHKLVTICNQ